MIEPRQVIEQFAPLAICLAKPVRHGRLPLPIAYAVLTMAICRTSISAGDLFDAEHVLHDLLWTEAGR